MAQSRCLHRVRQEDVGRAKQLEQSAIPQTGGVPVRIDRRRRPVVVDGVEDVGQGGSERGLQVVGAHVHVARALEERRIDQLGAQPRDRARHRDDRSIVRPRQDDGHAGGCLLVDRDAARLDARGLQALANVPAEQVVADERADRDAQAELGSAAGQDGAGATHRQPSIVDQVFGLAEGGHHVAAEQDQVRVRVAEDQQIDVGRHVRQPTRHATDATDRASRACRTDPATSGSIRSSTCSPAGSSASCTRR